MTTINRRNLLIGSGTLAAMLTLPQTLFAQSAQKVLRVVQPWEFETIQPSEGGFVVNRASVSENLVAISPEGRVIPALATEWSASDDVTEWRFRLRQGVVFHDGTPMTPEAARDSIRKLLPFSTRMKDTAIASVEAEGDELVFRLERPFSPFPAYLCDYAIGIYAPAAFAEDGRIAHLIATGPFKVDAVELPRLLMLSRHDAYWGEKPAIEKVEFDTVTNGETRTNIALAGEADVVMNIPVPSMSRIESSGVAYVQEVTNPRVHLLQPNCAKPQFSDVRVRKALRMAIDRDAIATTIMRNPALAATQYFPPVMPEWHFDDLPGYGFDVAGAKALLDEAGWIPGADGIREKDGVRFAGTVRTFPNRPELPVIASALQGMFREIGYDMAITVGESGLITEGKLDGTIDIALTSRNAAVVPDGISTIANDFVQETAIKIPDATTNWHNPEIIELIQSYFTEGDEAGRAAIRRRIVDIIEDEAPTIPIVWYSQIFAVSNEVEGFVNDPYEQRLYLDRLTYKG